MYVIMIVADALVPNRHQGISNHHDDLTVAMVSHDNIHIDLQQLNLLEK